MTQRCRVCGLDISVNVHESAIIASYCPVCGAGQPDEDGVCTGILRIGAHMWRVHIHPEFNRHDIEFRDGAGNTLVLIRNVG